MSVRSNSLVPKAFSLASLGGNHLEMPMATLAKQEPIRLYFCFLLLLYYKCISFFVKKKKIAAHTRCKSLYISLASTVKQKSEKSSFKFKFIIAHSLQKTSYHKTVHNEPKKIQIEID